MNAYGFAGGDPVNFDDPFGLAADLKIVGERLQKEVARIRKSNSEADATFSKLEQSPDLFVLFDSDDAGCGQLCYGSGWSFDRDDDVGLMGEIGKRFGGARGVAHVRPSHRETRRSGIGGIAWHEATHLSGIVERNSKYAHCEQPFQGVPNGCLRNP